MSLNDLTPDPLTVGPEELREGISSHGGILQLDYTGRRWKLLEEPVEGAVEQVVSEKLEESADEGSPKSDIEIVEKRPESAFYSIYNEETGPFMLTEDAEVRDPRGDPVRAIDLMARKIDREASRYFKGEELNSEVYFPGGEYRGSELNPGWTGYRIENGDAVLDTEPLAEE